MAWHEIKELDFLWKINERLQEFIKELKHNGGASNTFV